MAHCVDIESIYQLLEDGKRTWNVYLSDAIGHKPAQIFHTLVLKFRSYNAKKANILLIYRICLMMDGFTAQ